MRTSLLLLLANLFVACVTTRDKYCYQDDEEPYIQFSTKTAYELIRAKQEQISIPEACSPVMMWAFIRHGTRYPSKKDIREMKAVSDLRDAILKNHKEDENGELCDKDLQTLKNYTFTMSPSYDMKLSAQGTDDMYFLAKRLQAKFPSLLNTSQEPDRFIFFNDKSERTVRSREAFIDGLLGQLSGGHINETLQRPNKHCNAWLHEVKDNPKTSAEYDAFKRSNTVSRMITDINLRLGFQQNKTLDFDAIHLMYSSCTYEKAWQIHSRPAFCAMFIRDDLKILEYLQDLELYYKYSYGNDLNGKLACPFASDMVQYFKAIVENGNESAETKPKGVFYFSHMGTYIPLLTSLKLIKKDREPLLHSNYEAMSEREFKSSIFFPFAANLVAVLHKCTMGEQYRVQFHLNEYIAQYPECENGWCPWETVYEKLKFTMQPSPCNLDFCTRN